MADAYKRKKMEFYHLEQKGIAIGFCPFRPAGAVECPVMHDCGFCPFRPAGAVECPVMHDCRHCGWHPDVEEERKKRVREMLEEPQADTYAHIKRA